MATKVVTGKVRFSYVNIFEPRASEDGSPARYGLTLLIPKSDTATLSAIKKAMEEARENFCRRNGANSIPVKYNHTLHDGDGTRDSGETYPEECHGHYVIAVNSKQKPVIVDRNGQQILDAEEVYSGCYGRASINFYGYNRNGKKGVSAGLLAVQKLADGEPFGTRGSASDFADGFSDGEDDGGADFF